MAINQKKYDIEARNDDVINRNRLFFDFMQRTFNRLEGFYLREICLLIEAIMEDKNGEIECSRN